MSMRADRSARLGPQSGSGVSAVYSEQKHRVNDAKVERLRHVGGVATLIVSIGHREQRQGANRE